MAFPGTYNFNYYKGDTFEFRIYPKNSVGAPFDLTSYSPESSPPGNDAKFTISRFRGAAGLATQLSAEATISLTDNSIICVIPPTIGNQLNANFSYVYDIQIDKGSGSSATVITLLTGTIRVTDHITGAA